MNLDERLFVAHRGILAKWPECQDLRRLGGLRCLLRSTVVNQALLVEREREKKEERLPKSE